MSMISQVLQTSAAVKEQFRSEFNAALLSYQIDIGVIDEEIERMELEHKELQTKSTNSKSSPSSL